MGAGERFWRVEAVPPHRLEAYEADARAAAAACDPRVAVNGAHVPGTTVSFAADSRYGPLSAVVEAHALAMASTTKIDLLVDHALAAEAAAPVGELIGLMMSLSRLSGRYEQMADVRRLADRVMDRLVMRRVWRDHVAAQARQFDMTVRRAGDVLRELVDTSLTCALLGLALDDALPEAFALASQGPWRATLSCSGTDPGQRWRCSEEAERVLRIFFASLDACELLDLAALMTEPVEALLEHDLLVVEGRALTRAAASPPVLDMVRTPCRATASLPPVHRQLSLFAQLMATLIDGEFELDDDRLDELRWILGPHDGPAWAAA